VQRCHVKSDSQPSGASIDAAGAAAGAASSSARDGTPPVSPTGAAQRDSVPPQQPPPPPPSMPYTDATMSYDEGQAEVARADFVILMISAAIGVTTGVGVVLFNDLVHLVQDWIVWKDVPKLAPFGSEMIIRMEPDYTLWRSVLLPPIVAGVAVSGLRALAGGFAGDPRAVTVADPARAQQPRMQPPSGRFTVVVPMPTSSASGAIPSATGVAGQVDSVVERMDAGEQAAAEPSAARPGQNGRSREAATAAVDDTQQASRSSRADAGHSQASSSSDSSARLDEPYRYHGGLWGSMDDTSSRTSWAQNAVVPGREAEQGIVKLGAARTAALAAGWSADPGERGRSALRPYIKTLAAALTLGCGVSLGPEGPSAELGSANAANFRRFVPAGVCCTSCASCAARQVGLLSCQLRRANIALRQPA
jgi:hypothetical protein